MATRYSTNNSGGSWWLSDDDWRNLAAAGWIVDWVANNPDRYFSGDRWLGALATSALRPALSEEDAIAEWEQITGQSADDEGCECCGEPHYFSQVDESEVPLLDLGEVPTRDLEALESIGGPA